MTFCTPRASSPTNLALSLCGLLVVLSAPAAARANPPAKVDPVVEVGDDFFGPVTPADHGNKQTKTKVKTPAKTKAKTPERSADALFSELEDMENGRTTAPGSAAASPPARSKGVTVSMTDDRPAPAANRSAPEANASQVATNARPRNKPTRWTIDRWWRDSTPPRAGNLTVHLSVVGANEQTMAGVGAEFRITDQIGLRGGLYGLELSDDDDARLGAGWPSARATGGFEQRVLHRFDADAAFHFLPRSSWDLNVFGGLSHVGYTFDSDRSAAGGSLFTHLGAGLDYHYKQLFAGLAVHWHPYELLRYDMLEDADGDPDIRERDVRDRWDERRITGALRVGVRF